MRVLKMLPGAPTIVEHPVWLGKVDTVTSDEPGKPSLWCSAEPTVEAGMKIGYVASYFPQTFMKPTRPRLEWCFTYAECLQ